jgi:hypothetical protein
MHLETTFEFFKVKSHLIACDSVVVATFEQMCIFNWIMGDHCGKIEICKMGWRDFGIESWHLKHYCVFLCNFVHGTLICVHIHYIFHYILNELGQIYHDEKVQPFNE